MLQVKQAQNSRAVRCTMWSVSGYKELLSVCVREGVDLGPSEHSTGHKKASLSLSLSLSLSQALSLSLSLALSP